MRRTPEEQLAYRRSQNNKYGTQHTLLKTVLAVWGEVRNRNAYLRGDNGLILPESERAHLDNRVNEVLIRATKAGLPIDHYWPHIEALTFCDQNDYDLLLQYSIIADFRQRMWVESYMLRDPDPRHPSNEYRLPFDTGVLNYIHARRILRRYHAVPRATVQSWFPEGFSLI